MYDKELSRVKKRIKFASRIGKFYGKEIILFGVSDNTRQIISILRECDIEPSKVIDNDKTKQGSFCSGIKVNSPEDVDNPTEKKKLYIIYSAYWREMVGYLESKRVDSNNIWRLNHKPGRVSRLVLNAYRGRRQLKQIKDAYGDVPVFLCPYTGTGDIYLIGTFWNAYLEQNGIKDYVFLVITGACRKVANLFDIKNVVLLKKKHYASWIIDYYLYSQESVNLKILNDCWPQEHTNQVEWFRGYKGLYFTELFRRFVFNLPDGCLPEHPKLKDASEKLEKLFEEYKLIKGRTVILSPYSNTLSDLPMEFWNRLVIELKKEGYCVATNSSGKSEPIITGTVGVFFGLDIAPQFIEKAGYFIGVRSGLCDVISSSKAKKIILYDAGNRFYLGSAFEYFSLKNMQLSNDAIEYEFNHDDHNSTEAVIMKEFVRMV